MRKNRHNTRIRDASPNSNKRLIGHQSVVMIFFFVFHHPISSTEKRGEREKPLETRIRPFWESITSSGRCNPVVLSWGPFQAHFDHICPCLPYAVSNSASMNVAPYWWNDPKKNWNRKKPRGSEKILSAVSRANERTAGGWNRRKSNTKKGITPCPPDP